MLTEKKRIAFLQEEVKKHDELYEKNQPIITDTEYDDLYFELLELESKYPETKENSPTQKIITIFVDALEKVKHTSPILSLKKAKTFKLVEEFTSKLDDEVLLQEKLDGLTLVLTYENGYLIKAVTRGDGKVGENVLHTVKAIRNVPKRIRFKKRLIVRSECIMSYKAFEEANTTGEYASPRNLASGSVRQLNAEITASRNLEVIVTEIIEIEDSKYKKDTEQLDFVKSLGFAVVPTFVFNPKTKEGLDALLEKIRAYETKIRPTLRYMIDGLVIKTNSLSIRANEGFTSKYPKWAISFKFQSQDAISTLLDIIVQVGKMGTLTPVAILEPVYIGGTKIERATLHNFVLLQSRDIRIGDKVLVEHANDVIPKVVKAFHEQRTTDLPVFETPKHCPDCKEPVSFVDDNTSLICTNYNCNSTKVGKLQHFVSRNAMNIDGLGDKTIEVLYEEGIISSFKDLYNLENHKEKIIGLDKMGETSFKNMVNGVEKSKEVSVEKVLYSLAIPLVGESASRDIMKKIKSFDNLLSLYDEDKLSEELLKIDGVGTKIVNSLVNYLKNQKEIFVLLKELGLQTESVIEDDSPKEFDLTGLTICLTGSFNKKDRKDWKKEFESYGAKVTSSVTKKTSYLVMGDGTEGKSKHLSALDLGIPILKEDDIESNLYKK